MRRQNEMVVSFMTGHHEFMNNLEQATALLEHDLVETAELGMPTTPEWLLATEYALDDLANMIYSISEPRWVSDEETRRIKTLRHRAHDLYARYRKVLKQGRAPTRIEPTRPSR